MDSIAPYSTTAIKPPSMMDREQENMGVFPLGLAKAFIFIAKFAG